jgi:2-polyprenyl-6-methoxyphenol hydroxylase-like FAD-dependent oxidoreductase
VADSGIAKAAEDGWILAEEMAAAEGDVEAALATWEVRQLALGRSLLARTRDIGYGSPIYGCRASFREENRRKPLWIKPRAVQVPLKEATWKCRRVSPDAPSC